MITKTLYQYLNEFYPSYKPFTFNLYVYYPFTSTGFQISFDGGPYYGEVGFLPKFIPPDERIFKDNLLPNNVDPIISERTIGYILSEPNAILYIIYTDIENNVKMELITVESIPDFKKFIAKVLVNSQSIIFIDNEIDIWKYGSLDGDYRPFLRYYILTLIMVVTQLQEFIHTKEMQEVIDGLIEGIEDMFDELSATDDNRNDIKTIKTLFQQLYQVERGTNTYNEIISIIVNILDKTDREYRDRYVEDDDDDDDEN